MKRPEYIKQVIKNNLNKSGVYAIVCMETLRSYIGSSTNLGRRFCGHWTVLQNEKHENPSLNEDFIKYQNTIYFEVLEYCNEKDLLKLEEKWLKIAITPYNKTNISYDIRLSQKQEELFWGKVNKGNCWEWIGSKDKDGYGRIGYRINGKKTTFRANRLAYSLYYKIPINNYVVMHICNNPKCCNPKHLELGSFGENARYRDKSKKVKFTQEIIKDIRDMITNNPIIDQHKLHKYITVKYNLDTSPSTIIAIGLNKRCKDPNYVPPKRYIDEEVAQYIRKIGNNQEIGLQEIINSVYDRFKLVVNTKSVWRILRNERIRQNNYIFVDKIQRVNLGKRYNKEIKNYIATCVGSYVDICKHVNNKFGINCTENYISLIKRNKIKI